MQVNNISVFRLCFTAIFSVILAGCGGSGGGTSVNIPPQPDYFSSYTGAKNPQTVNATNYKAIVTAFLSEYFEDVQIPDSLSSSAKSSNTNKNKTSSRSVSETLLCDNGNSYTVTGDVDESSKTATLSTTFVECGQADYILNGRFISYLTQYNPNYDDFDRIEFRYENMEFRSKTNSTDERILNATIVLTQDFANSYQSTVINGLVSKNGEQFFYENYKTEIFNLNKVELSGTVYLSNYGSFSIASEGRLTANSFKPFPAGTIVVTSSPAKIRLDTSHVDDNIIIELDSDGDGNCDTSSVYDYTSKTFSDSICGGFQRQAE